MTNLSNTPIMETIGRVANTRMSMLFTDPNNNIFINNTSVALFSFLALVFLLKERIIDSKAWHATVTPLASIIGSGFLVAGPVLIMLTGNWAVFFMIVIVTLGYGLGDVIRFNIRTIEAQFENEYHRKKTFAWWFDSISHPVLAIAYIISVTFYLKLLSAFALKGIGVSNPFYENLITTGILLLIGITGKLRGLSMLEKYEIYSVSIKLSIIFGLLIGMSLYNAQLFANDHWSMLAHNPEITFNSMQKLFGMLIIIQGFETSRYLGYAYSRNIRIETMKIAQYVAIAIYLLFMSLSLVIFENLEHITETSIIDMSGIVAPILPMFLIFAAITSQFSAAVADVIGSSGLIREGSKRRLSSHTAYLIISLVCIGMTWIVNIYEIIAIASRAFALYYGLQTAAALVTLKRETKKDWRRIIIYSVLLIVSLLVVVLGKSVE